MDANLVSFKTYASFNGQFLAHKRRATLKHTVYPSNEMK